MNTDKFKVKNRLTNAIYRCTKVDDNYFVYAPKKSAKGWYYAEQLFHEKFIILPVNKTNDWHNRIRKVLTKIKASKLWMKLIPFYENLLQMEYEELQEIQSAGFYKNQIPDLYNKYHDKYPFLFETKTDDSILVNPDYLSELAECDTKTMYFGKNLNKDIKSNIKQAIAAQESYKSPRIQVTYDVSFVYDADKQKAWYNEEFRNCGNGYYYLAINENTAIFCEKD